MTEDITFRQIIAPVSPEAFFDAIWEQRPVHVPGARDKFARIFSWEEFNRVLNMSRLWSDRSMKIVLDGRNLDPEEFGNAGQTREGNQAIVPNPERVMSLLQRGATVTLDLIESLSPGVAAVAAAIQAATGSVAVCNAYCSWRAHQGFMAHFDTTDVIALHIAGTKRWRVYEGRHEHAMDVEGHEYGSYPPEHHVAAKGRLLEEIEMTPGDLLYLPRGQYHEALAFSDASLHLSFGICQPTGIDVIRRLIRSLPDEVLFRRSLPHFDRPQAHREHMRALAERLFDMLGDAGLSDQIRQWQRELALRAPHGQFDLPSRGRPTRYRVRSLGVSVLSRAGAPALSIPGGELSLEPVEESAARWIIARDYVDERALEERFGNLGRDALRDLLSRLVAASILDEI